MDGCPLAAPTGNARSTIIKPSYLEDNTPGTLRSQLGSGSSPSAQAISAAGRFAPA
jgi:hypothetical protein